MAKKKISLEEVSSGAEHTRNTEEEKVMTQILFRCTKAQKENINNRAKLKGQTMSGYIKLLLFEDGAL